MTGQPAPTGASPTVIVTQLIDERRWVVVCLLCAADRHEPVGYYDAESSARRARANHVRWHRELLDRGAACPTCGQVTSAEVRAAVQMPPLLPGRGAGIPRIDRAQPQLPIDQD